MCLAERRCTVSSLWMLVAVFGSHMMPAYSRIGRIPELWKQWIQWLAKRSTKWLESLAIILEDMMERVGLVDPIEHLQDNHGVISRNRWNASSVPRFMPWRKSHAQPVANLVMPVKARIISKTLNVVLNIREMFMVYMNTATLTLIVAHVLALYSHYRNISTATVCISGFSLYRKSAILFFPFVLLSAIRPTPLLSIGRKNMCILSYSFCQNDHFKTIGHATKLVYLYWQIKHFIAEFK